MVNKLISIIAVLGTYYGAWEHNWLIILVCAIPQFIEFGYKLKEQAMKKIFNLTSAFILLYYVFSRNVVDLRTVFVMAGAIGFIIMFVENRWFWE